MSKWIQRATVNLLSLILLGVMGAGAQTLTTIHDFGSGNDGENPQAGWYLTRRATSMAPQPWAP